MSTYFLYILALYNCFQSRFYHKLNSLSAASIDSFKNSFIVVEFITSEKEGSDYINKLRVSILSLRNFSLVFPNHFLEGKLGIFSFE